MIRPGFYCYLPAYGKGLLADTAAKCFVKIYAVGKLFEFVVYLIELCRQYPRPT